MKFSSPSSTFSTSMLFVLVLNSVMKLPAGMKNERLMESALIYASFAMSEMKKKSHLMSRIKGWKRVVLDDVIILDKLDLFFFPSKDDDNEEIQSSNYFSSSREN